SPGKILEYRAPSGPGIRLDDGVYGGWTVPNEYDPMLGKLIAWGGDRAEAIARLVRALEEYCASGVKTNVALLRRILAAPDFESGDIHTRWLDDFLSRPVPGLQAAGSAALPHVEDAAMLAAALWHISRNGSYGAKLTAIVGAPESRWKLEGRRDQLDREPER